MSDYRLSDAQKGIIGPIRLGTVRDLIEAGVVHKDVLVSKDGGPFLPIVQFKEIPSPQETPAALSTKPTYAGDIGKNTFFKVFYRLHLGKSTGLLVVLDDVRRKDVYMSEGQPVLVFSNLPYERLGEFLTLNGHLKRQQVEQVLNQAAGDEHRLGESMVSQGVLPRNRLAELLRTQQAQRLVDLCAWETGRYQFYDTKRHAQATDLKVSVLEILVQAAREMPERSLLRRLSAHYYKRVIPTPRLHADLQKFALSDAEKAIVKNLDGHRNIAEIASLYGDDAPLRRAALMAVYLLWEMDAVTLEAA